MSKLNLEGIQFASRRLGEGQTEWWGDADQKADIRVYDTPELATKIGVLLAGRKAVEIAQRTWSYAHPERDEPDLDSDHFTDKLLVRDSVQLQSQDVHLFRKDISYGVGLSLVGEDAKPFGLVIPGSGAIIHRRRVGQFKKVAIEAVGQDPLDRPINGVVASKAIAIASEYARMTANSREPVLL